MFSQLAMILSRTPDVYYSNMQCLVSMMVSCAESDTIAEAVVGAGAQEDTVHPRVRPLAPQGNIWSICMFKKILGCIPSEERSHCRYRSRSRH
jgi:hypothetical protein